MSVFEEAFGERRAQLSAQQRASIYDEESFGGDRTLNSADDAPEGLSSTDSSFALPDSHANDESDGTVTLPRDGGGLSELDASAVAARLRSRNFSSALSDDEGDDEDEEELGGPLQRALDAAAHRAPAPLPQVPPAPRAAATCPICWDEQPYIADESKRTAMSNRFSDFRQVIYRYYQTMRGRQSQETVLRGMLDIRRSKIERYLEEYSSSRFTRWTMQLLREHFDPANGHRFDPVIELDSEIEELRQLKRWTMEHGMWVDHPQTGERVFNIRAVDVRLRISRAYVDAVTRKSAELTKRSASSADADMIVQALAAHRGKSTAKRRRKDDDAAEEGLVTKMYEVGGL